MLITLHNNQTLTIPNHIIIPRKWQAQRIHCQNGTETQGPTLYRSVPHPTQKWSLKYFSESAQGPRLAVWERKPSHIAYWEGCLPDWSYRLLLYSIFQRDIQEPLEYNWDVLLSKWSIMHQNSWQGSLCNGGSFATLRTIQSIREQSWGRGRDWFMTNELGI